MWAEARLYGFGVVLGAILSNPVVCQAQADTLVSRALDERSRAARPCYRPLTISSRLSRNTVSSDDAVVNHMNGIRGNADSNVARL